MQSEYKTPHKPFSYAFKVDEILHSNCRCSLVDICKRLGYSQTLIDIISTNENDKKSLIALSRKYKTMFLSFDADEKNNRQKGKNRTWTEYFKTLISGWVIEDIFSLWLSHKGLNISNTGTDAERKILLRGVTNTADLKISKDGKERKLELVVEMNNILQESGFIEKRCPALIVCHREKSLYLHIDIKNRAYVLIDFASESVHLHLRHHNTAADWDKDVNRYVLEENGKKPRPLENLLSELEAALVIAPPKEQPKLEETIDEDSPPTKYLPGGVLASSHSSTPSSSSSPSKVSTPNLNTIPPPKKETGKKHTPIAPAPPEPQGEDEDDDVWVSLDSSMPSDYVDDCDFV